MSTVFIDRKGIEIKINGNSINFYSNGKREGSLPLAPLKRIVIVGSVKIETPVLHKLTSHGISVLFLTGKLRYAGVLSGPLHNNGILRVKQYEKSLSDFSLNFAKEVVKKKIFSQRNFIKEIKKIKSALTMHVERVSEILENALKKIDSSCHSLETLRGIEGSASSSYFTVYCKVFPNSLNFKRRVKRPPRDPVNAMLSLAYTLIHYEIVREIQLIGLDPTIGFYHQFEYGRESLACDLVELFRVSVDKFIYEIFRQKYFNSKDFMKDPESQGVYLKKSGRKKFYSLYDQWAQQHRSIWRQEVQNLARRILEKENIVFD